MIRPQRATFLMLSFAAIRALGCLAVLAMLAACAGQAPQLDQSQEAAQYAAHARGNYTPPGPPGDPWGPYIEQASSRFDVPDVWIRAVMNVESRGQEYLNGQLITSPVGAMGLMQVMPQTYDEVRAQYNLSDDAYDPYDNILAGAAYMREMYDMYGSPGFLAAYNAGPRRLDDYLSNQRPLPDETRRYVAMIAPAIDGVWPAHRSAAEDYAMNQLPEDIPPGLRYGGVQLASSRQPARHSPRRGETRVARLAEPPRRGAPSEKSLRARVQHRAGTLASWRLPLCFASLCRAGAAPRRGVGRLGGSGRGVRSRRRGAGSDQPRQGRVAWPARSRSPDSSQRAPDARRAVAGATDRPVARGGCPRLCLSLAQPQELHRAVAGGAVLTNRNPPLPPRGRFRRA